MPERVLIIEDDREIADLVALNLRDLGLAPERAADGRSGLAKALAGDWSLIVLDLMLPQLDGLAICRRIREGNPFTPILVLTARSEEEDRILGLELGADEYVTKPFSVRELNARVKALLRRARAGRQGVSLAGGPAGRSEAEPAMAAGRIELGGLALDAQKRRVTLEGRPVELTAKEFDLLALFARNPGRAYSRPELLAQVWGYQY